MITRGNSSRARTARRTGTALTVLSLAAAALVGCTSAPEPVTVPEFSDAKLPGDTVTQMQDAAKAAVDAYGASGAIVGVWAPWAGSWTGGVGTQSAESSTPVTTDMAFRLGPITRELTCDVMYGMEADGILSRDDSVTDYVIGMKGYEEITLEQLCDGTAGLAPIPGNVTTNFKRTPGREWKPRELASFALGRGRSSAPGETYRDGETGYLLLGLALERASGLDADEYYAKYVTEPLALRTVTLPDPAPAAPGPAPALGGLLVDKDKDGHYLCDAPLDLTEASSSMGYTDSGLTGTIGDLGRYARANALGSLTGEDTGDRFEDKLPVNSKSPSWYSTAGGSELAGSLIGQSGSTPGYSTAAYSDPETGLTVAVVINSSNNSLAARNLAFQLAAIASKLPSSGGAAAPEAGLPWTAKTYAERIQKDAICSSDD